ncbi:hypothetical protein HYC85_026230 [Camellia sinensis]|uniref:Uncharacterized protein n=1 Tax=Camellia sinensis TaxID=4442 RepID=A0A7J7G558_CAMSI|nr:hypothetical protein HYC85_026230 [Camellia sinensis]
MLSSICSKWRTFKKELTKYIRENKSNPEIISNPLAIYGFIEQRHWDSFLVRRLSEEFEILSQVQKWRRSQNKYNHRISRKGYARFQEDNKHMTGSTKDLDKSVLWKKARQNKNGEYDDKTIMEQAARIVSYLCVLIAFILYYLNCSSFLYSNVIL